MVVRIFGEISIHYIRRPLFCPDLFRLSRNYGTVGLSQRIQNIHEESRGTYGVPRIHAELADSGTHVGRKRVARLMRGNGIRGVCRRKWTTTTVRDRSAVVAPDLVKRHFKAHGLNQLWVADITYVPTWAGFLYVAVVLDVWSRRVVGWAFALHLRV